MRKETRHSSYDDSPACPVEACLERIGGKWKGAILYVLLDHGKLRFKELDRSLPNITERMLTRQLRELEADALIHRKVYAEVPPRVSIHLLRQVKVSRL